jgi:hypothetical protein
MLGIKHSRIGRKVLGITLFDRRTDVWIRFQTKISDVVKAPRERNGGRLDTWFDAETTVGRGKF